MLSLRLVTVVGTIVNSGGEVTNPMNRVAGKKKLAELVEVKPLVRATLQAAVVEVKSTHVNVRRSLSEEAVLVEGCDNPGVEGLGLLLRVAHAGGAELAVPRKRTEQVEQRSFADDRVVAQPA